MTPDQSIHKELQNYFSKSDKDDWAKIAMQELGGKNPFEFLSWRGKDEILFLPYYDAGDVAHLHSINAIQTPAVANDQQPAHTWANLPAVSVNDEVTANTLALHHLTSGADGILFDLQAFPSPDLNVMLEGIEWSYCSVAFRAQSGTLAESLATFVRNKFDPDSVSGALFWESIPKSSTGKYFFDNGGNFRSLGLTIRPETPAMEVCNALMAGVRTVESFRSIGDTRRIFSHIAFSVPTDSSLLESLAKFRALRMLWRQVALAYGISDYKSRDLYLHAFSARAPEGRLSPHENMLKGTFSAIAAIAGGCDAVTIDCEDEPPLIPRQARNISAILREESFFARVSDPLRGAYAVESITHAIAQSAWAMFQQKSQQL